MVLAFRFLFYSSRVCRYTLHDNSLSKISLEKHIPEENKDTHFGDPKLASLPDSVKDFILPSGFPGEQHLLSGLRFQFSSFLLLLVFVSF